MYNLISPETKEKKSLRNTSVLLKLSNKNLILFELLFVLWLPIIVKNICAVSSYSTCYLNTALQKISIPITCLCLL